MKTMTIGGEPVAVTPPSDATVGLAHGVRDDSQQLAQQAVEERRKTDEPVLDEPEGNQAGADKATWLKKLGWQSLLRMVGSGMVVGALVMFLFDHWDQADDGLRQVYLIGETALLALLGFASAAWLRDRAGARVLLGMALFSATASVTVVEALLYAQFSLDAWLGIRSLGSYADFARWQSSSMFWLVGGLAAIPAVLWTVSTVSLSVLARDERRTLVLLLMANQALLLLPLRSPALVAVLVGVALWFNLRWLSSMRARATVMRTLEGRLARLAVLAPLAVILVRSLSWYDVDRMALISLGVMVYLGVRQVIEQFDLSVETVNTLVCGAVISAMLVAASAFGLIGESAMLRDLLADGWQWRLQMGLMVALLVLPVLDLGRRVGRLQSASMQGVVWVQLVAVGVLIGVQPNALNAVFGMLLAIASGVLAWSNGSRRLTLLSALVATASALYLLVQLVSAFAMGGWASLSVGGVLLIVAAAAIDRFGPALARHRLGKR